ncbi:MAG: shikimate dehydrogenase [Gammaproteobacteria bacterium TMED34]|nr:MAG: shikimate dehydrogenase [Gammaproteobacteria bacterium TMED34]|tara:strand:+ start:205 stop:993 length:789 start_codon:yes stop_codon:yes gene_type:complete
MRKYLVIGNPIEHSLSPLLHNFWIKKHNINAFYEKQLLEKSDIEKILSDMRVNKIQGINVTVPFKNTVIPFLDQLSDTAEKTQSVNTIFKKQNKLVGDNTDVYGFTEAIKLTNFNPTNKKALILGAGGVVPSVIVALKNMRFYEIILSNRTKEKAVNLKKNFPFLKVINWGETIKSDLIINATSVGIKQNEEINLDYTKLDGQLFYDVIYNPTKTKFLENAKNSGKKIENGKNMFIYQAMKAFQIWHDIKPEINEKVRDLIK